jgi:ABC-type uncharacterized transport system substrate-binding protein
MLAANGEQKQLVNLAIRSRLPAIYSDKNWPTVGGLMSYSTATIDVLCRAAAFVDKILKGAPARRSAGAVAHEVRAGD